MTTPFNNQEKQELHGSMSSKWRQIGYLKTNYGDFQGIKPSLQHVYRWEIANCTGFGLFLDQFQLLRARLNQFDKMKQFLCNNHSAPLSFSKICAAFVCTECCVFTHVGFLVDHFFIAKTTNSACKKSFLICKYIGHHGTWYIQFLTHDIFSCETISDYGGHMYVLVIVLKLVKSLDIQF